MKSRAPLIMMWTGAIMITIAIILMLSGVLAPVQPKPVTVPQPQVNKASAVFPYIVQMPEDIGRLEAEVYDVCEQYASLDLSGMVDLCKRVGYQE